MALTVFNAIKNERFYILTHAEWTEVIQMRTDDLLRMENPRDPPQVVARIVNVSRPPDFSADLKVGATFKSGHYAGFETARRDSK